MNNFYKILFLFLLKTSLVNSQTLSGFVKEHNSGETLRDVSIKINGTSKGTVSNTYGFYALILPLNTACEVTFSRVGYQSFTQQITLFGNKVIDIELFPSVTNLDEVKVLAQKQPKESEKNEMSKIRVSMAQVKEVPVFLGEKDVIKTLQLLPGVQKGNEGSTGLYVRGGSPDQTLIILDDAVVYNANHLFGFFSTFNNDALKSVELTKGGFPARYGGRIAAVLDMQMQEGSKDKLHGEGSIGLISSKLKLEGPIKIKKPMSYLISVRRTYADLILPKSDMPDIFFYDINAKTNITFRPKDRLYFSTYLGRDVNVIKEDISKTEDGFAWGNTTATLRWNHIFAPKIFANTSLIYSQYKFRMYNEQTTTQGDYLLEYSSKIRDYTFKTDFDAFLKPNVSVKFGAVFTQHLFSPNAYVIKDPAKDTSGVKENETNASELGIYAEASWKINPKWSINMGLRESIFILKNKTYSNIEPRVILNFQPIENWAIKGSYSQMNQYIHLLSNSGLGLPTDLWVPATEKFAPPKSSQVALGIVKDFVKQNVSLSLEGYYKKMNNILGYKQGASFLMLDFGSSPSAVSTVDWQENAISGKGIAHGMELFYRKIKVNYRVGLAIHFLG